MTHPGFAGSPYHAQLWCGGTTRELHSQVPPWRKGLHWEAAQVSRVPDLWSVGSTLVPGVLRQERILN